MHAHQDVHGRLPAAVVYGADGRPLLSWRVTLLPFIEQRELYEQFRLDEPWDSPHNIKLLSRMPAAYEPPPSMARRMPAYHTIIHVFVGKGTAFEGPDGLNMKKDFPDDYSSTILLIEAGKPVPWTKPEELAYDAQAPLPELQGVYKDVFRVAFVDGHVRGISNKVSEATLRGAITRNGGETLGRDLD